MLYHSNCCNLCRGPSAYKTTIACLLCHATATCLPLSSGHRMVFHHWTKKWRKVLGGPSFSESESASSFVVVPPAYSLVHGGKRAVLIGVAYRSTRYELRGTITDIKCMKFLLQTKFGFPEQSILVLSGNH